MAKRIEIILIDDLDGSNADGTVRFGIGDQLYEIDLSVKHSNELYTALEKFRENGRRIGRVRLDGRGGSRTRARRRTTDTTPEKNKAIRDWAERQGLTVASRGRIPQDIVDRFEQAHAT